MNTPRPFPPCRTPWVRLALCCSVAILAGCSAEVAGTAAVAGGLSATAAKQAQAQQAQVVDKFKAMQDAGVSRAASAAD